jgi:hypothetical protein
VDDEEDDERARRRTGGEDGGQRKNGKSDHGLGSKEQERKSVCAQTVPIGKVEEIDSDSQKMDREEQGVGKGPYKQGGGTTKKETYYRCFRHRQITESARSRVSSYEVILPTMNTKIYPGFSPSLEVIILCPAG